MDILAHAYDADSFKTIGKELMEMMALEMSKSQLGDGKVLEYRNPDDELDFWSKYSETDASKVFEDIYHRSIKLHHPNYIGHQVTLPLPLSSMATLLGAHLNNGMAVYEMGQAASALERYVIDQFKVYFGYGDESSGIMTSGGTIANITALLCARNTKAGNNPWVNGNQDKKFAFMVSEQAHYCIDRAVRIMGWGEQGMIKVPVDANYKMRTDTLKAIYEEAISNGINVLGIVGSAPSTATGQYDDLEAIGFFAQKHDLWYHIDAAHGGPAAFSSKYKHLMHGSGMADSITVDGHKMMMAPALTTMLFFKNHHESFNTFAQSASYLFSEGDLDWSNLGKRTMECTKIMLSIRLYLPIQVYGMEIFESYVDRCYDLAQEFYSLLLKRDGFEVAVQPDSNIICFTLSDFDNDEMNNLRNEILNDGSFYIVKTILKNRVYLRCSFMNPFTTHEAMEALLTKLEHFKGFSNSTVSSVKSET